MNLPARKAAAPANPLRRLFDRKGVVAGQDVGWTTYGNYFPGRSPLPRTITEWLATYGGTDDSVSWVYACVSLISSEGAAYAYQIVEEDGAIVESPDVPDDLKKLLDHPNPHMTYFDFAQYIFMDLELAGNSYWLKDEKNAYEQPEYLLRLRPDLVQIAVDKRGEIIGYVYTVKGIPIPFEVGDIIHVRYPNPYDESYGMGTVEAIQRALGSDLAASEHVTGFYSEGGRISGILTVSDALSEIQFERLRQEFEQGFRASKSFGIMMVEQGTGYQPLTQAPAASGVSEIRSMNKDEILSAFGVPAFLLGGVGQGGIYKMSEAQYIFSRSMVPRARRFSERLTHDLIALWGLELRLDVTVTESTEDKLSHARELNGIGASLNEIRDAAGLPPIDDPQADEPLVQQGVLPFSLAIKQIQAQLPPDQSGGGFGFGGGGLSSAEPYDSGAGFPGLDSFASGNGSNLGPTGGGDNFTQGDSFAPPELASDAEYQTLSAPRPRSNHPLAPRIARKAVTEPEKPEGFESLGAVRPKHSDREVVQRLLEIQAKVFKKGVPLMQKVFNSFFAEQRKRLISRLPGAVTSTRAVGNYSTKQVNLDDLWRPDQEAEALVEAYLKAADVIGEIAIDVGSVIGASIDWTLTNPLIAELRDQLAQEITKINETTREDVGKVIDEGVRRGYSIPQIANGFPAENYKGISGVFDAADAARSETIARTETAKLFNNASLAAYEAAGVTHVEVFDGNYDPVCAAANGQKWTLAEAAAKPIAHPNCVRSFAPIINVKSVKRKRRVSTAVAALPSGVPDPDFRESNVRRNPLGQFADKPGVDQPSVEKPSTPEQPKEAAAPRRGSAAYLSQIGVPPEVVREIDRLKLDEPLKDRKGETAQRLLGDFKDTKEKFTDPKTGAYSEERLKLHDRIIDTMKRMKKPVYNPENGRVEWQLDPEGDYIRPPAEMKQRITDKVTDLSRQLAESDLRDPTSADGVRLRAEMQAWQDSLARLQDGRKRSLFLAGGNASGKSTALYSDENKDSLKPDAATLEVNFDLIKEQIPEFQEMAAAHDIYGTDGTHFESQDIARRLLEEGKREGLNVIVDASGDSKGQGFIETVRDLHDRGYETEVLMVDAPLEDAVRDMMSRAFRTGRYVPTPIMAQIHQNSVARMLEWKDDTAISKFTVYRRHGSKVTTVLNGGQGHHVVRDANEFGALESKARGRMPDAESAQATKRELANAEPVDGGQPPGG